MNDLKKELALTLDDKKDIEAYLKENKLHMGKQYEDFIRLCELFHLNPLKRDIYLIRFGNVSEIVVGYEVYRRRAASTGIPYSLKINTQWDAKGLPFKTTATLSKLYKDGGERTFERTLLFKEFAKFNKQGDLYGIWKEKPTFMLEKCAEATILRMAYPETLSGIPYTKEEMETEEIKDKAINVTNSVDDLNADKLNVAKALYTSNVSRETSANATGEASPSASAEKEVKEITLKEYLALKEKKEKDDTRYSITLEAIEEKTSANGKKYYLFTSQEGEEFKCFKAAMVEDAGLKRGDLLKIDYVLKGDICFLNNFKKVEEAL